ncbi:MAG: glycosyltransferase family 4 protein [Candidatus Omnitrophica bacterium]|nr:glycosyltransferase family 4 protein [Candidatus Omnitrophota bacterium]
MDKSQYYQIPNRMKIAYIYDVIYPYVKGGAERSFWELAKRLSKRNEVHLFGMKSWEGPADFIKEGVHIHGIGKSRKLYSKSGIRNIREALSFSLSILPALFKERFDLIDCNAFPYLPYFPVKLYSLWSKTALVITWQEVWDRYWYGYAGCLKGLIGRIIERMVIITSGYIIAHSQKTKDALYKCGFRGKGVKIIWHGVGLEQIQDIPPAEDKADLIFAGRLIKDKNVDMLITALALIKKELPDISCFIIGEGPQKEKLISQSQGLGLKGQVHFKGFMEYEHIISQMKSAKIFVFPSTREGFGMVALEAMAAGLPVITVEHPMNSSTELIQEGINGVICQPDAKELASNILSLLKDRDTLNKLSRGARRSTQTLDWDKIAVITEDFYKEAIRERC